MYQRYPSSLSAWLLWVCALLLCSSLSYAHAGQSIRVGGTGSGSAVLEWLARDYQRSHPDVSVQVVTPSLGSGGALRALHGGKIDLAVLGRPPKAQEQREDMLVLSWARTPLVFASSATVHPHGLRDDELLNWLSAAQARWPDQSPVRWILRNPAESDSLIVSSVIPGWMNRLEIELRKPGAAVADTDIDAIELLEKTPGSLGTSTLGLLRLRNSKLHVLSFNGVVPSVNAMAKGEYPLIKNIYLAWPRSASPATAAFISWLQAPSTAQLLRKQEHEVLKP